MNTSYCLQFLFFSNSTSNLNFLSSNNSSEIEAQATTSREIDRQTKFWQEMSEDFGTSSTVDRNQNIAA